MCPLPPHCPSLKTHTTPTLTRTPFSAGTLHVRATAAETNRVVEWVTSSRAVDPTGTFEPVHFRCAREAAAAVHDTGVRLCPLLPKQSVDIVLNVRAGTRRVDGTRWSAVHPVLTHVEGSPRSFLLKITTLGGAVAPLDALEQALVVLRDRAAAVASGAVRAVETLPLSSRT